LAIAPSGSAASASTCNSVRICWQVPSADQRRCRPSGNEAAISVPRLERSITRPASTETSARNPSYFGSPAPPAAEQDQARGGQHRLRQRPRHTPCLHPQGMCRPGDLPWPDRSTSWQYPPQPVQTRGRALWCSLPARPVPVRSAVRRAEAHRPRPVEGSNAGNVLRPAGRPCPSQPA
jgi:hypothetical protein